MSEALVRTAVDSSRSGVAVEGVSHGFDGTRILHDVTICLSRAETLVIIGPSGTGKSTLLRLLSLFGPPDRGTICIDGTDVWSVSERERLRLRRSTGMVFQEPNLFDASVRRNVEYGRHIREEWGDRLRRWLDRLRDDEIDDAVSNVLEIVGLREMATQPAASVSGGEAQRVAFARALACDPEFLFLDEPTADLDPRNTAMIEEAIETAREQGVGVVVATHDMHQAERIADRVGVLLDGRLIEVGRPERIFHDPHDDHVRQFIEGELVY